MCRWFEIRKVPALNTVLYCAFVAAFVLLSGYLVTEQRRHLRRVRAIPVRVLVNGIRGKSSVTRLCRAALAAGGEPVVGKTTGSAARYLFPSGKEVPIRRRWGMPNVVEQIGVIRRAVTSRPWAAVIECMAVMPDLQELNTAKLIQPTIVVITNVREDHLEEMGPTLEDVARSLCRSMPTGGVCITAERDLLHILRQEATRRGCALIAVDPAVVTAEDMAGFTWITFPENVAIALRLAELMGVPRDMAVEAMHQAAPDPGVLTVEQCLHNGREFAAVNLLAANDPRSTVANVRLLQDRRLVGEDLAVVINCRADRIERNGQMGVMTGELDPAVIYLIGQQTHTAARHVPERLRTRIVDLGGPREPADIVEAIAADAPYSGRAVVMVGNIHGGGEELVEALHEARDAAAERRAASTVLMRPIGDHTPVPVRDLDPSAATATEIMPALRDVVAGAVTAVLNPIGR